MIYDYKCVACEYEFFVLRSITDYQTMEPCEKCSGHGNRVYKFAPMVNTRGFDAGYFPSLGKAFTNKRDLDYHLEKNNLVCIGNDYSSPEKMHETSERDRQKARDADWEKTLEKITNE